MPYTKAISPVSNSYLTKGKEYDISSISEYGDGYFGHGFYIIADNGEKFICLEHNSKVTGGLSWQLK